MAQASCWEILSGTGPGQVILGVDFPAAGRTEAGFADLLEKVGPRWDGYGFWLTVPPPARLDRAVSGQDYVRQWTAEIRGSGRQVVAVMGYCAGSVYAAAIAEDIARWQQPAPKVILFDPHNVDPWGMADEMYKMIDIFGSLLTAEQTQDAKQKASDLVDSLAHDIFDLAVEFVGLYRQTGLTVFDRLGLTEDRRSEILGLFESYMAWLTSTRQIDPNGTWQRSPAILSAEYVAVAGQHPAVTAASAILSYKIPLECSHGDLLRSDSAARTVLKEIAEQR
jgi:hypothetical protein